MFRDRIINFIILSLVFIVFGCCIVLIYTEAKEEEEMLNMHLEYCISNPDCIHKVRHLPPEAVSCIQDTRCYEYLRRRIVK